MTKKDVHVTPHDHGWQVKRSAADRASSLHDTKREAVEEGRRLARADRAELFIHNEDGRISDRDSFGSDPFPPRDKRH